MPVNKRTPGKEVAVTVVSENPNVEITKAEIKLPDSWVTDIPPAAVELKEPPVKLTSEKASEMVLTRWERSEEMEKESAELWQSLPIEEAIKRLSWLRGEAERGSNIINARISQTNTNMVKCSQCPTVTLDTKMVFCTPVKGQSGIFINLYCCSALCYEKYIKSRNRDKQIMYATPNPD